MHTDRGTYQIRTPLQAEDFLYPCGEISAKSTKRVISLEAPIDAQEVLSTLDSSEQVALLLDASGLHAETVMYAEEKLFEFYSHIAEHADGRQLILIAPSAHLSRGLAALPPHREDPRFFFSFLTAALRTSAFGRVSLLLPNISSTAELAVIRRLIEQAMRSLLHRSHAFDEMVEIGLRIDTPAAALLSKSLAEEVDFLTLELDRLARLTLADPSPEADQLCRNAEAVLHLAEIAVGNAHMLGRFMIAQGDMASNRRILPHLLSMGVDALALPAPRHAQY